MKSEKKCLQLYSFLKKSAAALDIEILEIDNALGPTEKGTTRTRGNLNISLPSVT